ncbi:MAG: MFS transporter [Candidatus Obscuribacterales bacterium]|nr:MFS transporter [Candidatus Obscuribacterales bacterium]
MTKALRTMGFGALSVVLALYLREQKFSELAIGAILSATLLEDALFTVGSALLVQKFGMRAVLIGASALLAICGCILICNCPQWLIVTALVLGIVSPSGFEGGPFSAIEQSIIASNTRAERLTRAYSDYNLWGFAGAAGGALLAGLIVGNSIHPADSYHVIFAGYAASGLILAWLYSILSLPNLKPLSQGSARLELVLQSVGTGGKKCRDKSLGYMHWLAGLQCIDAFGGGFVTQSILSYWFVMRFHTDAAFLGYLFCATNVLAAVSFWAAPFVARRFGLLATMVFTHLPCSMALCLMPFLPSAGLAAALLLFRSIFSSMDIPVRQAYTMLLVVPEDRPYAAALTSSARALAQALAPIFSGWSLANVVCALPFVYAGALKSIYDISMFARFSHVHLNSVSENPEHDFITRPISSGSQLTEEDFEALSKLAVTRQTAEQEALRRRNKRLVFTSETFNA